MTPINRFEHLAGQATSPGQASVNARTRAAVARLAGVRRRTICVRDVRREAGEELRRERYVLGHESRQDIKAVVLVPNGTGPWPAVLVCPGRNAGLERVTGLTPPDYPDRDVAVHLARAGYLTLTFDYGIDGVLSETRLGGRDAADVLDGYHRLHGGSLLGVLAEDALAALTWLETHPDAEPGRTGLFGHSLGAAVALCAALLREQPPPVCAASHLGTYAYMMGEALTWNQYVALPSILRVADLADLYAALAPSPLQVQYGDRDPHTGRDDADGAGKRIRAAYAAVQAEDAVDVRRLPMGHGTGLPEMIEFFDRALAGSRAVEPEVPAARIGFSVSDRVRVSDLVDETLASGRLTLGPHGTALEEEAMSHLRRGVAAVSSGSAAVEIALRVVGVGERTVLVPANTFFATAASAIRAGARVEFVDMELDGLGMDPASLRAALDAHDDVAAVVGVHIAGTVSPGLPEIEAECAARGVAFVEDAAHALGSAWNGRPAGAFGRLAAFSLYPTKVVTSGEGGLITADGDDLDRVKRLRDHGKRSFHENVHAELGSNWRMSDLHAAVGLTHLSGLAQLLAERRRLASWYDEHLGLSRHAVPEGCASNHYKYVAYLPPGVDRADVKKRLRERGVTLAGEVYDVPLHRQPYFADACRGRGFPRAEWFADHHICLPLFPGMTTRQQERVVTELHDVLS